MKNYNPFTYKFVTNAHQVNFYNTTCDVNGEKIFPTRFMFTENEDCVIRHYKTKTIEEYIARHKYDVYYDMNIRCVVRKLKEFFDINNNEEQLSEKIDIIKKEYPWYTHTYKNCEPIDIVIVNNNNVLLEYTLKSIRENLTWINNIYIVSDEDIKYDGTIIIRPCDIIPKDFDENNYDIGLFLHNIKDLSERFIYVYSGTIFNYPCFEKEFFKGNEVCVFPLNIQKINNKYKKICFKNNMFFLNDNYIINKKGLRKSKIDMGYMFSYAACPMLKNDNEACFIFFKNKIFESKREINHLIYPTWSRIILHSFNNIHTSISSLDFDDVMLELIDPVYKIMNIDDNNINEEVIAVLKKKYGNQR